MRTKPPVSHKFAESPVLLLRLPAGRSRLISLLLLGAFIVLVGRAFYLQVLNNDFLQEKGDSRYRRDIDISASRGRIADRNGEVLAVSTPMKSIWAIPADARLNEAQVAQLAGLLEIDAGELRRKLASGKSFVFLQRQIPPELAQKVADLKLPGIGQNTEYRRFYPSGEMSAHLVGFTGIDDQGQEGVELAFQNQLLGRPGSRTVIKDRRGHVVEDVGAILPPQDGQDIRLALDSKIQYFALSKLKEAIAEHKAKAGGIVVADARTGEVLALANWPTYNPNNRESLTGGSLRNRAVTDTFEPGSTLKPFSIALALEKGKFRADSVIDTSAGRLTIGRATISDAHRHGPLTVAEVIQKSSNVGTAKIASTFAPQEMWEMLDSVGFGQVPGLGFPGEVAGRLRPWQRWRPIEQATISYGHGISVSLIQLVRAYTVFARDGELIPLSLTQLDAPPANGVQVFSPRTARQMRSMLEMVVERGGTAPQAQVPGYRVGGKTGTANKLEGGRYTNRYVASFIGMAPMSSPRLIVAVMIDEPQGKYYGGSVAGPVFSAVMGSALRTLGVPPDAPQQLIARAGTQREAL